MPRYEYVSLEIMHGSQLHGLGLNRMGDLGWELVGVVSTGVIHVAYMKRPLAEQDQARDRS